MKKKSTAIVFLLIGFVVLYMTQTKDLPTREFRVAHKEKEFKKRDKRTRMDLAMEQEIARTKDPALGFVPRGRMKEAYQVARKKRLKSDGKTIAGKAIAGVSWRERGPSNVGGRTRAIMIDPNDPDGSTIWSASVSGGLWKTSDITVASPDWIPVNDLFDNMAITALAYDPTDTDVMYFGTGEGFFNVDAVEGNGIWKSTDGGDSWNQLAATVTDDASTCSGTGDCDFLFVNDLAVTSSGTVIAATRSRRITRGGVMRSTDGGLTWTNILEGAAGTNPCRSASYRDWATDIEIAADGDIFVAFGIFEGQGIFRSQDDGATWTQVYTTSTVTCDEQRIELATAPSDADYIYALVQENDNSIKKIMRSVDGGNNWADVGDPTPLWFDQECTTGSNDFTRGQAWYDLIAAVDPNDRDVVYIGGIDLLRTTDGGDNWTQLTNWAGNCELPEVHADQHQIIYQPGSSDVIYFGNDGGIYRTSNGSAASPTFERKEFNYNTTQFYSVAMHPTAFSPEFIGGAQDNGSNKVSSLGISTTVESTGGDGGFAHIDQDNPDIWITAFTNANISRSLDGGLTFSTVLSNGGGSFINPTDYDNTSNVYYGAFTTGTYFYSTDLSEASPSWFSSGTIAELNGGTITHVSVSQNTTNTVFFGTDNGTVAKVADANNTRVATDISGTSFPNASVSCIAIEDGNDDHLLVTFSNYGVSSVWETTNGGTTWTATEGDLPDMPIRWALFNPNNNNEAIIATELGVWSTDNLNGAATEWEPSNDGLANVRTDMLQIRSSDNLVVAATHGRGFFTSDIFTSANADFVADRKAIYAEASINFTDASYKATSWTWDFGDGGTSSEQNPTHTYQRSGKYAVTLTINGGAATETKTDYIHVLPNLPTPFSAADGGDFESNPNYFGSDDLTGGFNLWELGTPSNAVTTLNSGTNGWKTDLDGDLVQADYSCALFSPNFNMSASGTYTLSFRKSNERRFTNAPFATQVQYSTDNGENWTRLGSDNDSNGTNWYEYGTDPTSVDALETDVIFDRTGFNGNYTNELTEYDISFLSGNETVAFRFVLYVNAGYSAGYDRDGFMIDDFEIQGTVNEANVNITDDIAGSALSFDGTDDYATLSDLTVDESFTAEMWIAPVSDANGQTFLAKHDVAGADIFKVGYNNNGVEVTVGGQSVSGGSATTGLQHLAVTVEKVTAGTSEVTVYRDGVELYQSTVNDVIGDPSGLDWVLGQDWDGVGTTSEFFSGTIDELRIWNSVRTADQIKENNFLIVDGLDTNLIGYWQFNENNGSTTANAITGNTGSLVNGTTWVSSPASVAKGISTDAIVTADGTNSYGDLDINLNGVTGTVEVVVFELLGTPGGTLPSDDFNLNWLIDNPYYVINTYGTGSFTSADLTYTYGAGAITENDPSKINLFKRPSTSAGSWSDEGSASTVDTGTGQVTFDGITSFSQTTVGSPELTLPVELSRFEGKRIDEVTRLEWTTLSEVDNDRFEVLRSTDGKSWSVIGTVKSSSEDGFSNQTLQYSYTDRSVVTQKMVFYQLKQIDFDGASEMSQQIAVKVNQLPSSLRVYPIPAADELSLYVNAKSETAATLEVIGMDGKTYYRSEKFDIIRGDNLHKLNLSNLKNGMYLLIYQAGEEKQVMKIIVDH